MESPTTPIFSSEQTAIMDKLKETIFRLANSNPNTPLSPSQISLIEERLLIAFPVLHTPTHPTYSAMIQGAIKELNEEDGSDEESISEYIKANYDDLPWAHDTYLSHHLSKLCDYGEVVCTYSSITCKRYMTPTHERNPLKRQSKRRLGRRSNEYVIESDDNRNSDEEKVVENFMEFEDEDISSFEKCRVKQRRRSLVFMEDDEVGEAAIVLAKQDVCNNSQELVVANEPVSNLKESELMIVPYVGNTDVTEESAGKNPVIVCGLAELPKLRLNLGKKPLQKRLKVRHDEKEVCLEPLLSLPANDAGSNPVEQNQLHDQLLSWRGPETEVMQVSFGLESETSPPWLTPMLKANYYIPCSSHANSNKNECKMFCLDCMGDAFCSNCLSQHKQNHRVVQIRKSSYHNVVRVNEIGRHLDISLIQTYIINSAKVVFLNARPPSASGKSFTKPCEICGRGLLDSSKFCSLGCKLCAKLQLKSSEFNEVPVDQSQQACTLSLPQDGFNNKLERQKHLDPSHPSSSEGHMSMEDEENLPLQKVLEKRGKQKKHAEKKRVQEMKEDAIALSNQDLNKPQKKGGRGRPSKASKGLSDTATGDCDSQHQKKQLKKGSRGRPSKQMEAIQEDVVADLNFDAQMQEVLSQLHIEKPKKDGRGRPRKHKEATKEDSSASLDSSELAISQCSLQLPKKDGRGRPRKHIKATENDAEASLNLQKQDKKPRRDGRGRLPKQLEATTEDVTGGTNLSVHQKEGEGSSEAATNLHPQKQIKQLKKGGRGRPRKQKQGAKTDATSSTILHIMLPEPVTHQWSKQPNEETNQDPEASMNLHLQENEQKEIKEDSAAPFILPYYLEEGLSGQEKEHKVDDFPDTVLKRSQNQVQRTPDTGQVMPLLTDDIQPTAMTTPSDNQPDQHEEQQYCHEQEAKQGNEEQVSPPQEKLPKITVVQVPLSSKDQLRSRIKRQAQDNT